jgi:hypothetical protein
MLKTRLPDPLLVLLTAGTFLWSVPGLAEPSVTVMNQRGLNEVTFKIGDGRVQVYVPGDTAAGDTISGAICINRKNLNECWLEIGTQKIGACLEHYTVAVPPGTSALRLCLRNKRGEVLGETSVPVAASPPAPTNNERKGLYAVDSATQSGNLLRLSGRFDGDVANTSVTCNDLNCLMVAESPRRLFVISPPGLTGRVAVTLKEQNGTVHVPTNLLSISVKGPALSTVRGQRANITLVVNGLAEANHECSIRVVNNNPGTVQMDGGNDQVVSIPRGYITFTRNFGIRTLNEGHYTISAWLW